MTPPECAGFVLDILTGLAIVLGGLTAVFVFFQLAPVLSLRIVPTWTNDNRTHLHLRFEIENKSKVRVYNPRIRVQVVEHDLRDVEEVSEWVPFDEKAILPEEPVIQWRAPSHALVRTVRIYPGETVAVERLYACPRTAAAIHIGLQVEVPLGLFMRTVTRKSEVWRQTTTAIIAK